MTWPGPPARHERVVVWSLAALYAATYSFLSIVKYRYYLYTDFDFAIFLQTTDRILHGSFDSSIAGLNLLGAHSVLNLVLLAPIYAAFRHPVTLLVLQSMALALGAIPVHRLACRRLGPGFAAVVFAALYLLYPALGYLNLFEFHPEAFSVPALLFTFDFALEGRLAPTALCATLALLGREDVALVVAMLGLYLLITRRPRATVLAATLVLLAGASLALTFGVLQRRYATGEVQYMGMYRDWGHSAGEVIAHVVRDPLRVVHSLVATPGHPADTLIKRQYYFQMLLPLLFLPFLSPWTLAIALPIVVEHFLSWRPNQHSIIHQYTALVIPFVIAASVLGFENLLQLMADGKDWRSERGRRGSSVARVAAVTPVLALCASLGANLLFGPLLGHLRFQGIRASERFWPNAQDRALRPYRDRMVARVPRDAGVVASFEYLPRFAARANVHSFSHLFAGHYTFSTKPYPAPRGVGAMLTALGDQYDPDAARRIRQVIAANGLRPVDAADDLVLYLAGDRDTLDLIATGDRAPASAAHVVFDSSLAFQGCDLPEPVVEAGGLLTLRTCWSRVADGGRVFITRLWLYDAGGRSVFYRTRYLGYGLATADRWPAGRTVRESYRIVIPGHLPPGPYRLVMQVVHRPPARGEPAVPDDPGLVRAGGMLPLGAIEVR